ncbi:BRO family protein [Marinobacterium sp. BA1]|uniref:BRO family protein n=1 Tax=Marinobacterium sp. BA1 TaxID=3138931 RepID=UPI0032E7C126
MKDLTFQNTTLTLMPIDGEVWIAAPELARALGYARSDKVTQIYSRHSDEFSESMSMTTKLRVKGFGNGESEKDVRIFSLRGAHLIAMFARTSVAKAFRRWVLDILDALHNGGEYVMERYRKVSAEYSESEQIASRCGKGLNHWRNEKPRLKSQLEYWRERQQLCLELN